MSDPRDDRPRDDLWSAIEAAAPSLRREWDSSELWPRIEATLREEGRRSEERRRRAAWLRLSAAAAALVGLAVWLTLVVRTPAGPQEALERREQEQRLLTERAHSDAEGAEAAYVRSIDALAELARKPLQESTSPLLVSYREKLALLDAAIAECRAQADGNRFNAHLRRELLSMYQEKQRTLEQVLREGSDDRS